MMTKEECIKEYKERFGLTQDQAEKAYQMMCNIIDNMVVDETGLNIVATKVEQGSISKVPIDIKVIRRKIENEQD